jgi:thiamine biosynthesis protein ThiI
MHVLIRMSPEIVMKSDRVRGRFQQRLVKNIEYALKFNGIEFTILAEWSRIEVKLMDPRGLDVLQRVFGIQQVCVIEAECPADLTSITETGFRVFTPYLDKGESFAIRSRRYAKDLPFTSLDINLTLGSRLNAGRDCVNLSKPDRTFHVEVRSEHAYFYGNAIMGAGGLPLGTGGRAICLISGGFDSGAAAWMIMKRGVELDFLLCNLAGGAFQRSVVAIAKGLHDRWGFGSTPKFYSVDFSSVVTDLTTSVQSRYVQVILKRLFYRAANLMARVCKADGIVTGEAIGQVSSQTLQNLRAIDIVAEYPVLRPLIAYDKEEIIDLCRRIGTDKQSSKIQEFCHLAQSKPVTACRPSFAASEESKLDRGLLEDAVAKSQPLDLLELTDLHMRSEFLSVAEIPSGAIVIDVREREEFDQGHVEGAKNIEFTKILGNFKDLEKSQTYIICCPHGTMSGIVAEKMQAEGYLAYSYRGGLSSLRRGDGDETGA